VLLSSCDVAFTRSHASMLPSAWSRMPIGAILVLLGCDHSVVQKGHGWFSVPDQLIVSDYPQFDFMRKCLLCTECAWSFPKTIVTLNHTYQSCSFSFSLLSNLWYPAFKTNLIGLHSDLPASMMWPRLHDNPAVKSQAHFYLEARSNREKVWVSGSTQMSGSMQGCTGQVNPIPQATPQRFPRPMCLMQPTHFQLK
jgi:hypothetical protein